MYLFFGIFFLVLLFFFFINHWRKKRIIKKICSMCACDKCQLLDEIIAPFGFSYIACQDIFTSRMDAWQHDYGYCALYDRTAYHFNLVFDSLPVYFDYKGRTWLVELWKGQYGINTGGEIGVYYSDRILDKKDYDNTLFKGVDDKDMLGLSFQLYKNGAQIANVCGRHWWQTAFSMGRFSRPADLCMRASITFPSPDMARAFAQSLICSGFCKDNVYICCNTVSLFYSASNCCRGIFRRFRTWIGQCMNRFWCRVYLFVTRPFCLSMDRILYLYYYLPFTFRKMLRIRKYKKYKPKRR